MSLLRSSTRTRWTTADIPDQTGRTVVVTGANSGLGAATAGALAGAGASVVLACRNTDKGERAASTMTGDIIVRALDLADLSSVREFAEATGPVDVLVNNAGIMAVPQGRTADGFELQLGTNFLGHFALTGLLLDRVTDRVVTLSSGAHRIGKINLDDLNWEHRRYHRWLAYGQSKLADLIFAYELARRLETAGSSVRSVAAHPGYAATELQSHTDTIQDAVMGLANKVVAQSAADGALPTLYAASMPDVRNGEFYGPDGIGEVRGFPRRVDSSTASKDIRVAEKLWAAATELTGVSFG
ncbi:oxidoreductase [uncultured Jatrophihabitans sp.]|uniref:oxidoreductase n=1 Tax=uncultured Jatrophihabitans sp. TaxID=1610747 RepID=UPI0035CA5EF9